MPSPKKKSGAVSKAAFRLGDRDAEGSPIIQEVVLTGGIESGNNAFQRELLSLDRYRPLMIHLSCHGGSAFEARSIAAIIRSWSSDTHCLVSGLCSSAAMMIFCACDFRWTAASVEYMVHPTGQCGLDVDVTTVDAQFSSLAVCHEDYLRALQNDLGLPVEIGRDWTSKTTYLSASDVVALGWARYPIASLFGSKLAASERRTEKTTMLGKSELRRAMKAMRTRPDAKA